MHTFNYVRQKKRPQYYGLRQWLGTMTYTIIQYNGYYTKNI